MIENFLLLNTVFLLGLIFNQNQIKKEEKQTITASPLETITWVAIFFQFFLFLNFAKM